jgi:tRNA threonylcarbamoyladenosine biosynthesis protein TsaE
MTFIAETAEDMVSVAEKILEAYPGEKIFTLTGDLGAGKTTFVKAFAKCLGIVEEVSSPTFSLVHEYGSGPLKIFHFDLYRIKSTDELFQIGFEEYLEQGAYVLIEWPEPAKPLLPEHYLSLQFEPENKNSRKIVCGIVNNG